MGNGSGGVAFSWRNQQPAGSPAVERTSTTSLGTACRRLYPMTVCPAQQLQMTPYPPTLLTLSPATSSISSSTVTMHDDKIKVGGLLKLQQQQQQHGQSYL